LLRFILRNQLPLWGHPLPCRDLGSNALILPAAGKAGSSSKGAGAREQQPEQQLSKSQLKKLRQVQLKKERRQQLSEVRGCSNMQ
jgi:hypothetical protein